MEQGLTKQRILSELSRSAHGKLIEYLLIGQQAARDEAEFFTHLIAWDAKKGSVRDAKAALPIITLSVSSFPEEFVDNSLAHLALLSPRELLKAVRFALEIRLPGRMRIVRRLIEAYLHEKETNFPSWERTALQHRSVMKELYALCHVKPADEKVNICLFGRDFAKVKQPYPNGSLFDTVAQLKIMSAKEAAGVIIRRRIPFLIAIGALGDKAKDPDLVLALIQTMTPTELVTNTKMLERLGVKSNPALRGAFEQALEKASTSKKNVLKTTRAAEQMTDEGLKEQLRGLQERQIKNFSGVDGNWLVLGDKSGSMSKSIEAAKEVAAVLTKMVKGKVWLVFFDTSPRGIDVSGKTLDEIKQSTRHVQAGGGTSIGCGLNWMLEAKHEVDGIAIVSDGGENQLPYFAQVYPKYSQLIGKEAPVYLYQVPGDDPRGLLDGTERVGIDIHVFDLMSKTDYVSLPNLVATMNVNRYSLVDEVMETPLRHLEGVLNLDYRVSAKSSLA